MVRGKVTTACNSLRKRNKINRVTEMNLRREKKKAFVLTTEEQRFLMDNFDNTDCSGEI